MIWLHSSDVQASCENNVSLYCIGSNFHFLVECRITHNSCSIFKFTTCLIQSYNGAHYQAFRNICEFTDICKWSALPEGEGKKKGSVRRWATQKTRDKSNFGALKDNLCPFINHFYKTKLEIVSGILFRVNLYFELGLKLPESYCCVI